MLDADSWYVLWKPPVAVTFAAPARFRLLLRLWGAVDDSMVSIRVEV